MARYDTFTFRIGPAEAEALARLADQLERSQSDAVRILIRNAARERGLLPTNSNADGRNPSAFVASQAGAGDAVAIVAHDAPEGGQRATR